MQPATLIWADPGGLSPNATRFYRPGTAAVSNTEVFIRLSQKAIVKSLRVRSNIGPGGTNTDTWTVRRNGVDTSLAVTFQAGDSISLKVTTGLGSSTTDTVVQIDIY